MTSGSNQVNPAVSRTDVSGIDSASPTAPVEKSAYVRIPVCIAKRQARLSGEVIEELFCDLYRLHPVGSTTQSGEYDTTESVTVVGPAGRVRKVPILGPPAKVSEIVISRADALALGMRVPARESGDLVGTPGVTLEGPRCQVRIGTGLICVLRHVRASPKEALRLGLHDGDRVEVAGDGECPRPCFRDVVVRVIAGASLGLHLDADEAAEAGLLSGDYVHIVCGRPND